ncbi:MAG TPA: histidinol-phosphate transaminase, partial [Burkholderiales bacterium]|nr:histidinol-phosphate transaminase [Burkholderiales bacterium]
MSRYWSEVVRALTPYVPGEQPKLPNLVKLNTNESPYGPSRRVLDALRSEIGDTLRLYPDPGSDRLCQAIAKRHGLEPGNVFVGNGSDEVLAHVFFALLRHDAPVLFPDITYSFYPVYCGLYGIASTQVPLTDAFEIRIDDYLRPNGGIIFPNPNAPTGCFVPVSEVERLLRANTDSVVVIDEAYVDFGGESVVPLVRRYPQLLVTHTLSKSYALAGLRVGYATGHADLIEALNRVKNSFNSYPLDRFAQAGAAAAMEDQDYFRAMCAKVVATKRTLVESLESLGFEVLPSAANFVFARYPGRDGGDLAAQL